jgi:hypothetical protein
MSRYLLSLLLVFFTVKANAQLMTDNLFSVTEYNYDRVSSKVEGATLLKLNNKTFDEIFTSKPFRINLNMPVDNSTRSNLTLERFEVMTPDAKGVAMTSSGPQEFSVKDIIVSYKGSVDGIPNSFISLNFSKNGISGVMMTETERYVIGKMETMSSVDYLLYKESNLKMHNDFSCGTTDEMVPEEIKQLMSTITGDMRGLSDDIRQANIAIDIDFATYNDFGSNVNSASAYAMSLISTVSILYLREMNVKLVIPHINVWTVPDPYTGTGSNTILNQFRSYWNSNNSGVQRTLAHLISTRSGGLGGIAWVNVLCASPTSGFGYGFSNTDGAFNQIPTYSWDVDVVAHELGHNFGSPHTHSCSWSGGPIDTCYTVEGGCYNGPTHAITGTIMSYCHLTSGGKFLSFGPQPRELIRSRTEVASCMTSITDQVLLAFPNGGEVFRTYTKVPIIWGAGFTGNVNVELSTDNGVNWTTLQSNIPASQNEYIWDIPNMDSVFQAKVRVYNSGNPSMGDTSDAVFSIYENLSMVGMALVSPPTWAKFFTSPGDTSTVNFVWKKAGQHPDVRYKWSIKKIGGSQEYFFTSNNAGIDTSLTVSKGFLDSIGRNVFGFGPGDSVACTWRTFAYNGFDSVSSNINILVIADNDVGINMISQEIPGEFKLFNNYPNPFNPQTKIDFALPKQSFVNLKIYDYLGREVAELINSDLAAGTYSAEFNATNGALSSGVYFYRITAQSSSGTYTDVKRMMLIK